MGLLQTATSITKCDGIITNCDGYYKVRQYNVQSCCFANINLFLFAVLVGVVA